MPERAETNTSPEAVAAGAVHKLHVIVNPAAGQDVAMLAAFNQVFQQAGLKWQVSVTNAAGDGTRLAREIANTEVDVIGVYGGDGTVVEVANGLAGTGMPLAIFPGGTANTIARELGIPTDLEEACQLVLGPANRRRVDAGQAGERLFLIRLGLGLDANVVAGADREKKDRLGVLAYALSALQELAEPKLAHYRLELDGKTVEARGLTCIVANTGLLVAAGDKGERQMNLAPGISVSDGLLDVLVVSEANLGALAKLAASVVAGGAPADGLQRWQAREIQIDAHPAQCVEIDGEVAGNSPVEVKVVPGAITVLVPPDAATGEAEGDG